jgi:hypothetical protein
MFKKLLENLDIQYVYLLLHTEAWWLGRGRVLNRVPEMKGKLQDCFQENSRPEFAK